MADLQTWIEEERARAGAELKELENRAGGGNAVWDSDDTEHRGHLSGYLDALRDVEDQLQAASAITDPDGLGGAIVGDLGDGQQPGALGGVVLDTRRAIIPDYTTVSLVDDHAPEAFAAVLIEGRLNRSQDRARVMLIGSADALAAWVTELIKLANIAARSPMRKHREWATEFRVLLDERLTGGGGG